MAELRHVLHLRHVPQEHWEARLWWSRFRRAHQAHASRCHIQRRARQAPLVSSLIPEPIRVPSVPALTDALWERLRPLLPAQKPRTGRPATDHRLIVEGMLWVVHTGSSWRELPKRFGPWQTVVSRYQRWSKAGIWTLILQVLQAHEVPLASSA